MTDTESIIKHVRREKVPVIGIEPLSPSEGSVDSVGLVPDDVGLDMPPDSVAANMVLDGNGISEDSS
jgi:hypothetical protein